MDRRTRLNVACAAAGTSISALADRMGVGRTTLYDWAKRGDPPTEGLNWGQQAVRAKMAQADSEPVTAARIAEALGCPIEALDPEAGWSPAWVPPGGPTTERGSTDAPPFDVDAFLAELRAPLRLPPEADAAAVVAGVREVATALAEALAAEPAGAGSGWAELAGLLRVDADREAVVAAVGALMEAGRAALKAVAAGSKMDTPAFYDAPAPLLARRVATAAVHRIETTVEVMGRLEEIATVLGVTVRTPAFVREEAERLVELLRKGLAAVHHAVLQAKAAGQGETQVVYELRAWRDEAHRWTGRDSLRRDR